MKNPYMLSRTPEGLQFYLVEDSYTTKEFLQMCVRVSKARKSGKYKYVTVVKL